MRGNTYRQITYVTAVSPWMATRSISVHTGRRQDTGFTTAIRIIRKLSLLRCSLVICGPGACQVRYPFFLYISFMYSLYISYKYSNYRVTASLQLLPAVLVPKIQKQQQFCLNYNHSTFSPLYTGHSISIIAQNG